MNGYLARLKSKKLEHVELTKLTPLPFVSNVSTRGEQFSEIAPRQPDTTPTEAELFDMIRQTVGHLDAGRDWTGWREALTPEQRQRLKVAMGRADTAYCEMDRDGLAAALHDYREACLQLGNNSQKGKPDNETFTSSESNFAAGLC